LETISLGELLRVFPSGQFVAELINYAGEPRYLLYGADWPISDMDSYLSFVSKLKLKKEYRNKLMYQNSRDLFNI